MKTNKLACYLADEDIFKGIKNQVNNANGALKGKIETLVGAPSVEQWCKAYNKQSAATGHNITAVYSSKNFPGYIFKVNNSQSTVSGNDYATGNNTIWGNDIYGAAGKNGDSSNPFYSWWWIASPSSNLSTNVCHINGYSSYLINDQTLVYMLKFSLFASVSM